VPFEKSEFPNFISLLPIAVTITHSVPEAFIRLLASRQHAKQLTVLLHSAGSVSFTEQYTCTRGEKRHLKGRRAHEIASHKTSSLPHINLKRKLGPEGGRK
jgi:hypothetical protein